MIVFVYSNLFFENLIHVSHVLWSTILLSRFYPVPPIYSILCSTHLYFFFSLSDSNCCYLYIHRYQAIQWDIGNVLEAIFQNKTIVYSPWSSQLWRPWQLGVGLCEPFPLHIVILTDLILYKSCACTHKCCDFKCHVMSWGLPYHQTTVFQSSPASESYSLSSLLLQWFRSVGKNCVTDVLLKSLIHASYPYNIFEFLC